MLHLLLTRHRAELIRRAHAKAASRSDGLLGASVVSDGVSFFLSRLTEASRRRMDGFEPRPLFLFGKGAVRVDQSASEAARQLRRGVPIARVVQDYGDVCQSVTELALELGEPLGVDEIRTLDRCLEAAVARAMNAYALQRSGAAALTVGRAVPRPRPAWRS